MNDKTNSDPADDELNGFDTFEDEQAIVDDQMDDNGQHDVADADFQDVSDDPDAALDADVFGEEEPAPAPKKKSSMFNIIVALVAVAGAGGLIWTKMGPQIMGSMSGAPQQQAPGGNASPSQAAQQAVEAAGSSTTAGLLDNPEQFAGLGTEVARPVKAPPTPEETLSAVPDPFANVPNAPTQAAQQEAAGMPMPTPISTLPLPPSEPVPVVAGTGGSIDGKPVAMPAEGMPNSFLNAPVATSGTPGASAPAQADALQTDTVQTDTVQTGTVQTGAAQTVAAPAAMGGIDTVMPQTVSNAPVLEDSPEGMGGPVAVLSTMSTTTPGSVSGSAVSGSPVSDSPVSDSKVESLESRLDAIDARLNTAMEKLESASTGTGDDQRLNSIQSSLERLESRLDSLSSGQETPRRQDVRDAVIDDTPAPVQRASTPKKTTTKQKTPAKSLAKASDKASGRASDRAWDQAYSPSRSAATQPASTQPVSTQSASTQSGGGWSLRGAQPGRAVIGKGEDIREVGVGDTVPGLGQVTGIATVNGRWVVQGTQGRLAQ